MAWQEPLQDPEHFAEQSAVGAVPLHWALHLALQLAEQCALQSACAWPPLAEPSHCALQSVPHVPSQLPVQLNVPGLTLHFALQSVSQLPEQLSPRLFHLVLESLVEVPTWFTAWLSASGPSTLRPARAAGWSRWARP